jgi:predicted  nucleic acid-binding Zn-ribbon protein
LREQLVKLIQLQELDSKIRLHDREESTYPAEIRKIEAEITRLEEEFQQEVSKIETLEKERRQRERDLETAGDQIKKIQGRLHEVKTNKEYQAFLSEIDHLKEKMDQYEVDIIEHLDEVDNLKEALKEKEKAYFEEKGKLETRKAELEGKLKHLPDDLRVLKERRDHLAKGIPAPLLKRYTTLLEKRGGLAVVYAVKEICQGCHMNIPPQLFNQVQRAEEIYTCPHCNRILVPEEEAGKE